MGFRGVTNAVGEMEEYAALNNIEILSVWASAWLLEDARY